MRGHRHWDESGKGARRLAAPFFACDDLLDLYSRRGNLASPDNQANSDPTEVVPPMATPAQRSPLLVRCLGLVLIIVPLTAAALTLPAQAGVTIHCLDIGQGDATLVISDSGQSMLIDGGENGMGTDIIVPYLTGLGITELDFMIATHYHADHIGGLDEVFHQIGVDQQVYDRGWNYPTTTYNQYAAVVSSRRATITDGQVIDLGAGVTVTCLGLNGNGQLAAPFNVTDYENEYSISLLIEAGDFDFFVAGDLIGINSGGHRDIESSVAPEAGEIEVYQVNHQASYTSSNSYFLALTQPEVAIISVGDDNPYGHPHQEILDRLSNLAFVYQTESGSGGTLPPTDLRVVNDHILITTDGYDDYFVDGDQYVMDEPPITNVPGDPLFALQGNHPNPFNPTTSIVFSTTSAGRGRLTVYDLTGSIVYRREFMAVAGIQSLQWHGTGHAGQALPSGVYVYEVEAAGGAGRSKLTLLK